MKIINEMFENVYLTLAKSDCRDLLSFIGPESAQLVITSPPYNVGKEYEKTKTLEGYLSEQREVLKLCEESLKDGGSLVWQVGNYIDDGEVVPLDMHFYPMIKDMGLQLRNRIVWTFGHGLHCKKRFSGRYETALWFTKGDDYYFDLDPVRVPQKYPGKKHFRGDKKGKLSCNPKGKNPSDHWDIPNVKHNHVEKTDHPCQFPIGFVERFILSTTKEEDLVVDPYAGSGTTLVAALTNGRSAAGCDIEQKYIDIAMNRVRLASEGNLPKRDVTPPSSKQIAR